MRDMLVKLLELPSRETLDSMLAELAAEGINIRRAMVPDMYGLLEFVDEIAGKHTKGEVAVCFSRQPVSCFIAEKDGKVIGYACYEATMRNFFGPTRVLEEYRGKGVGKALVLSSLYSMRDMGYAYAIIGGVGPAEFYVRICGATLIENSTPGIYKDYLRL